MNGDVNGKANGKTAKRTISSPQGMQVALLDDTIVLFDVEV